MSRQLATHRLARALHAEPWSHRPVQLDECLSRRVAAACRLWFPELTGWSDAALTNAFGNFWRENISNDVAPPEYRDCCFLIYLYVLQYVCADAFGRYRDKAGMLEANAFIEIEAQWLGRPALNT